MDILVTLYHGESVEKDVYENVSFYGTKKMIVMFEERSFLAPNFRSN